MTETSAFTGTGAIVTGGGSGIGAAMIDRLAALGARVLVVDRDASGARAVGQRSGQPWIEADVTNEADWTAVVAAAADLGPLRYVLLNAGVNGGDGGADVIGLPTTRVRAITDVNLLGVILGTRSVVPALTSAGGGHILVTASGAGLSPYEPDPVYSAAKHGAVAFVRSAARALTARHVSINAFCPVVAVDTPMLSGGMRARIAAASRVTVSAETVAGAAIDCLAHDGSGTVWECGADGAVTIHTFTD